MNRANVDISNGFRLGEWQAYPLRNLLVGPAGEVHVEPKVMQLLERLATRAGEVVLRDELLDELWGGRAGSDEPLTRCVATLRRELDDSSKDPVYIQTIPKRGYRLVCPVESLQSSADDETVRWPGGIDTRWVIAAAFGLLVVVAVGVVVYQNLLNDSVAPPEITVEKSSPAPAPDHSIAVLPFANLSDNSDNDYLSDGLATELLHQLTAIPALKVIARPSAFAFKQTDMDVTEIARQLGVQHLLLGSVRQSQDRLRITAELVEARDGYQIWTDTWDRAFTDIFDIQDEIAESVVASLRIELLREVPSSAHADPEAYKFYLQSREALQAQAEKDIGSGRSRLDEALALVTQAIAVDPDYAPAWSQLASIQKNIAAWQDEDYEDAYLRARASAQRALDIDPAERRALAILGLIAMDWDWDYESAARWLERAHDASPGHPDTLRLIAYMYGRFERSPPAFVRDLPDTDPLNVGSKLNRAYQSLLDGELDEALEWLRQAREIAPDSVRLSIFEALHAYYSGDYETAARADYNTSIRVCALHRMGRIEEAHSLLGTMLRPENSHGHLHVASAYACLGDNDTAFEWLHRAYDEREYRLAGIRNGYTLLRDLRDDPRWQELLEEIGISDDVADSVDRIFRGR